MRVKYLSEQATAELKERRRQWQQYARINLATLDLIPGGHPNCPTYGHPNCSTWPG